MSTSCTRSRQEPPHQVNTAAIDSLIKTVRAHGGTIPTLLDSRYPHVLAKIAGAWGSRLAMRELMEGDLLMDHRGGREGFAFAALVEITSLNQLHKTLHPEYTAPGSVDVWAMATGR